MYVLCILAHEVRSNCGIVSVPGGDFIRVSNLEMYDFRKILKRIRVYIITRKLLTAC